MNRAYYADSIANFLSKSTEQIIGTLSMNSGFAVEQTQINAWASQITILNSVLSSYTGSIYFEFSIPRMGRRIDVVLLIGSVIFVLEFKIGAKDFLSNAIDQVCDYALDLKNFHEPSHNNFVAPLLIATGAHSATITVASTPKNDKLLSPIKTNSKMLGNIIETVLKFADGASIEQEGWEKGRYSPTPTIVEAAMALYAGHSVDAISRSDAGAINLSQTSERVSDIIKQAQAEGHKSLCFVTGVPGAGKTLVGLKIATEHIDKTSKLYSVFLSGNGPLVDILREALARDKVRREQESGIKAKKGEALSEVRMFIQNVHHFRDACIQDQKPPIEHVALFDEAQRAWDRTQTASFMSRKKRTPNFDLSEPEYLISCLDRHDDWAVIVCLVGGGQEINTGEAGITEWIESLNRSFPKWRIYVSPRLTESEYGAGAVLEQLKARSAPVQMFDDLHLSVSMRSFRAENVSLLVKHILDINIDEARSALASVNEKYPIVITRNFCRAKSWLKEQARGSVRYGIIVSSQAERLKPHAIDVKTPVDPVHWFLDDKDDVRSSYFLEDVATEFHVQGLELDWACVTWDADFRYSQDGWEHWTFHGSRWKCIRQDARKMYLKNAYRVLLTRARQGMVIVVPNGDAEDQTRKPAFYDRTFQYLKDIGFAIL
jgi:hypothetical protein